MRYEFRFGMARSDDRAPATAPRVGDVRRLPVASTARASSPRQGAPCVHASAGRLASPAQSGRTCFGEGLR